MGSLQGRHCLNGIYFGHIWLPTLVQSRRQVSGSGRNRGWNKRREESFMLKCPTYSSEEADILE